MRQYHRDMVRMLVGTRDGLREFDANGTLRQTHHPGRNVTAIAPEGFELWAVIDGDEVWHTAGVEWWFRVASANGLTATCLADTRAGVIVGTSEAHLMRVAGEGLEMIPEFDDVPQRSEWYTPWGGPPDTRSVSEDADAVYVNVHVGGILRSRDHGQTWRPTIDIDSDVHRVLARPGIVYAACGYGLALSPDHGDSWSVLTGAMHASYCRGVAVCGDTLLASASTGPGGKQSALYRGNLHGAALERCRKGLPEWFDSNIDSLCLDALPDGELTAFGTNDGRLFASSDLGNSWGEVAAGLGPVNCVLVVI
jgi:hypothetical protein